MDDDRSNQFRDLPRVDAVAAALGEQEPHPLRVAAARRAIKEANESIRAGHAALPFDAVVEIARAHLQLSIQNRLVPVINATGVILHTNLGRAPLSAEASEAAARVGSGYSNLEYDLSERTRGSRYRLASDLIRSVTGAEAALVTNNNAAAILLVLSSLARGSEVIVSRGELIEIGGEFRIPDIMNESGAIMREVGTTNRTHLKDYLRALTPATAAILKVHPSNYRVVGFASSVPAADLSILARQRGVLFIHDVGSGLLSQQVGGNTHSWLRGEPAVEDAIREGADVVTFSGDKLLGGPQAGIIAGRKDLLDRLHQSPLLRAIRVDKLTLAALTGTLLEYLHGREAALPVWRMALVDAATIESRAQKTAAFLSSTHAKVGLNDGFSTLGGGSAPGSEIPTVLIEIYSDHIPASELLRKLAEGRPPVIARVENDRLVLDLRTVEEAHDEALASTLAQILSS